MEKYLAPAPIGEGDLNDGWLRFKREFQQFLIAIGKGDATEQVKLAIFLRIAGPRVNDLYETMEFDSDADRGKFSVVSGKLDGLSVRRTSKHVIRDKFFQLKQAGKTIDSFVMEIRKEVKDCQFGDLKADLMLHVLLRGIDDERMRRRLFETDNLDLAKAIRMCQTMEATAADLQHLGSKKTEVVEGETAGVAVVEKKRSQDKEDSEEVAAIGRQSWKVPGRKQDQQWEERRLEPRQPGKQWTSQAGCSRCGYEHKPRQCPAYGKKCAKCQVLGHFARVCRARDRTTHMISDSLSESGSEEAVLLITVEKIGKKILARVPLRGRDRVETIECQLDTAASCNVMSVLDYEKLGKPKLRNSRTTLSMYDGTARKSLGVVQVGVSNREGKPTQLVFELLETRHHTLLSLDTCLKLNLLSYEIESVCLAEAKLKLTRKHILEEYSDVFSGIGCLPGKYNIQTDASIPPVQN